MCGIAGFVQQGSGDENRARVLRMMVPIQHRGPDDSDCFVEERAALGHTRLSIIDIASGHQPMVNEDGTIQLVFNGEIFNFQELREQLRTTGHVFKTQSDTEVIVHGYEEWGSSCVDHFNGQYAFAVWDRRSGSLFLARDRIGIIPLYFKMEKGGILFASEIKSILAVTESAPSIGVEALNRYLGFGYTWDDQTLFEGICKLRPGHTALFRDGRFTKTCYWDLYSKVGTSTVAGFRQASETFHGLLTDAIRLRLISDVPLGLFLSGGLDSSILVALSSTLADDTVNTFSVAFNDASFDESGYAAKVAQRYHTRHRVLTGEENAADILENVVWHLDEPISDQATIPTYLLTHLTKQHVTVALSGDGSDELFGGYNKYIALLLEDRLMRHLPRAIQKPGMAWIRNRMPFREDFYLKSTSMPQRYFSLLCAFLPQERQRLLVRSSQVYECENEILRELPSGITPLQQAQLIDLRYWLVNDILIKTDKMSMAASLETRVPYLDHRIIEFALNCPDTLKIKGIIGKYLLKRTYHSRLPFSVVWRKKQGFNYPLEEVFSGEGIDRYFRESSLYTLLDREQVQRIVAKRGANAYFRRQFRNLFFLFVWNSIYIDKTSGNSVNRI
ncbi:MAG: asparagine synthase (glutamine-hydrolyzing) [Chitinispirillaceae bacterium]|nr:asparagine synthase (glutamine-hydrolyzing) [Chitinispirillaceae bacterium]